MALLPLFLLYLIFGELEGVVGVLSIEQCLLLVAYEGKGKAFLHLMFTRRFLFLVQYVTKYNELYVILPSIR